MPTIKLKLDHLNDTQLEQHWDGVPSEIAQAVRRSVEVSRLGFNADDAGVIFAKQLQVMTNRVIERPYPQFKAKNLIPIQNDAPFGARTFTYKMYDKAGIFELITNYADDLPVTSVRGEEKTAKIEAYGGAVHYDIFDIAAATVAGFNLKDREMVANRDAAELRLDKTAWLGDEDAGLFGLFNHPNTTQLVAAKTWETATAQEMYDDLVKPFLQQEDDTNGMEQPDTIVMSARRLALAQRTRFGDLTGDTVLSRFKTDYPNVTIDTIQWAINHAGEKKDSMIHFRKDSTKLGLEVVRPYTVEAPQVKNLATVINATIATGGVVVYAPLSVTVTKGI
ncbi:major capsid protein [Yersinia phage vB_YenM_636]|nr:hypothetical protein X1_88 [Yersinia phage vB_Yen_X1]QKN86309.1 major capsid protein [Yersinia phage vB_YenM_12]QKN86400.1 major capsid protein [Yersinia phage vB_YenM_22]QKN86491.1 major capsid protein [Yersinia phage vB_YenM_25]QKN86582.1 major capsid protein [Yersinia phage vB_YenM_27]QKN86673.1 major capsid protein [Yersinia phage vB_YenM_39]QKN86764.1 major capsid protein [Yersinia phage vB_YenM_126]QKN86855.1 major capsid protein [Yersinia phage vB_YenM_526-1]QKN86946.1 major capsi